MAEAGMFAAGLRVAVEADIKPLELGYGKAVDPVLEHRLTMARTQVIREAGIRLLPIPRAYVVLPGEAFIPVLGLRAEAEVIDIRPASEVR
jgi:hypothetical protein